jgi:hypothetical protein
VESQQEIFEKLILARPGCWPQVLSKLLEHMIADAQTEEVDVPPARQMVRWV